MAGRGRRVNKIGLYEETVRRQPASNELLASEFSEGDVSIHHHPPGSHRAMQGKHRSDRRACCPAVAIAGVNHAWCRDRPSQASLTDAAFAKELRARADQPVVVQCL